MIPVLDFLPRVLPIYWRKYDVRLDGAAFVREKAGFPNLRVLVSAAVEMDGKKWIHVSCSHSDRLPSWETLKEVKNIFIGRDRQAIQVLPREVKYVNQMPYCLHLFACLDEPDPVPDFTRGGPTL